MSRLDELRRLVGPAPRSWTVPLPPRPSWAGHLTRIWAECAATVRDGEPVIGHVFTVNQTLWEEGDQDRAAGVIYSFDPGLAGHPERLRFVGDALRERTATLREQSAVPPARRPWERWLQDRLTHFEQTPLHERVPPELTRGLVVYHSTVMLVRDHLPHRRLVHAWVPLLVQRAPRGVAVVPPAAWWPEALRDNG